MAKHKGKGKRKSSDEPFVDEFIFIVDVDLWRCEICSVTLDKHPALVEHVNSKLHRKKAREHSPTMYDGNGDLYSLIRSTVIKHKLIESMPKWQGHLDTSGVCHIKIVRIGPQDIAIMDDTDKYKIDHGEVDRRGKEWSNKPASKRFCG